MDTMIDRRNRRLANQVYDTLRMDIVTGAMPPGASMSESDICARLGVSRTPVREALIELAKANLVLVYPQRGTFVAPISADAFRDAQFIREHLECALVGEAVRHLDSTALNELNAIIDRQRYAYSIGSADDFYQGDEDFHAAIARLSRRPGVHQVLLDAKIHFDRVRHMTLQDIEHIPLLIEQHREILDGMANGDEAAAVAAMRRHLREVFHRAEGIIARQQAAVAKLPSQPRRIRRRAAAESTP
jgi:DNA-binding GntR family transcriptional regulator